MHHESGHGASSLPRWTYKRLPLAGDDRDPLICRLLCVPRPRFLNLDPRDPGGAAGWRRWNCGQRRRCCPKRWRQSLPAAPIGWCWPTCMSAAPAGLGRHPARSARSAALRLSWVCRRTRQHGRDRHALAAASVWRALDPRRGAVPLDLVLVMLPASCPALARPDWPRLSRGAERQRMCLDEADPDDPPPSPCLLVSEPCLLVSDGERTRRRTNGLQRLSRGNW